MPVLQALPFLPAGRGALILILGGLVVLPLSLLLSGPGKTAVVPANGRPRPAHASPARASAPAGRPQGARGWVGTGLERALRQAVGWTELLEAAPGHYVVRLGRCGSCAARAPACETERSALEGAVGPYLRGARVAESACVQWGGRGCTFDIRGS